MANFDDSRTTRLERLTCAFDDALNYPHNKSGIQAPEHTQKALSQRLDVKEQGLFDPTGKALLHFLEVYRPNDGYHHTKIRDAALLDRHLKQRSQKQGGPDPLQRFIFLGAPSSREPLRVTRQMLMQTLSYHQVMPAFLEFVFPFGRQIFARDMLTGGFRSETYQDLACDDLKVPELERSGLHIELCYNLKSVESSENSAEPWAIRQCSVHHKFDLVTQRAQWIVLKANPLMREAITQHLGRTCGSNKSDQPYERISALARCLAVHRIICSWSAENWQWYIDDLESRLQKETRRTLYVSVEQPRGTTRSIPQSMENIPVSKNKRQLLVTVRSLGRAFTRSTSGFTTQCNQPGPVDEVDYDLHDLSEDPVTPRQLDDFDFSDLQKVQLIEDKANEALLLLKANCRTLRDLGREYNLLGDNNTIDEVGAPDNKMAMRAFQSHLTCIEKDIDVQQSRLEGLLRIAADRKSLMQGILSYQSMKATRQLAEEAQQTAESMERIAKKTVVETVSMRIITVVTLIFLPGTFVSTLMSTPIVDFDNDQPSSDFSLQNIGWGALQLYLAISLPLFCITALGFLVWYLRAKRNEDTFSRRAIPSAIDAV